MDLAKLSRDDLIVGGLALFLVVDLLFLPWYSLNGLGFTVTITATEAPHAIWGVLAVLAATAFVSDLALERFGSTQLPAIGGSRARTRMALAAGTLGFVVVKLLAHASNLGFGFWLGLLAAIALVVLCARATAS